MKAEIDTRWCICGGPISVLAGADDKEIFSAVMQHNKTVRHKVWRERGASAALPMRDAYEDRLR